MLCSSLLTGNSPEAFCQRGQKIICKAKIRVMQTWFKGFWSTGHNTSIKHMNKKTGKLASRENSIWSLRLITSDKNNDLPMSVMKAGLHNLWVDKLFIGKCVGQQNQGQRGTHTNRQANPEHGRYRRTGDQRKPQGGDRVTIYYILMFYAVFWAQFQWWLYVIIHLFFILFPHFWVELICFPFLMTNSLKSDLFKRHY